MNHHRLLLIITIILFYHSFSSFHGPFFNTREKKVLIFFMYAMASSYATLHSMLKSCDPPNEALEFGYIGGYIPIPPTDFDYIWHCLSYNYPRATEKISSRYLYYFWVMAATSRRTSGLGGLEVACWPLVTKFAGSNPAEAVGFFRAKNSSARLPSEGK